ncbi:uncharacterized protein PV07_12752 [Cladophialophora immunda]|uniref:Uncharacterized protein n=1 Tax=Cladophialophora immunda TaxID=569365 RepID=A0A0D2BTS1_9EURO|nr:uncharacterized protein PV07_12752 [Cladophialophora immunda]KIW21825.1 hypothetical protein PV07_12752 [Cladophialophora immunda]
MSVSSESSPATPLPLVPDFDSTPFGQRKRDARDIVSSFDRNDLPSEFCPDTYKRITVGQAKRPSSEWTITGDLPRTIMTWMVHDPNGWALLNKCLPMKLRTKLFVEKLQRRFQHEFDRYDEVLDATQHLLAAPAWSPEDIRSTVIQIAANINSLAAAARLDLDERPDGPGGTAHVLLEALKGVCLRSKTIPAAPTQQGGARTESEISLYDIMIRRPLEGHSTVILEALEKVSKTSPGSLNNMGAQFRLVGDLMPTADAASTFWLRFRGLSAQAGAVF